ncbi:hypothetical protein PoB_000237800 [Plakobranchus ocellatus]|uniref:Uncharacterized protein n=1 Tax=Plakobranchus ocellatus TaxID=259542 RepID=A0AAV3XZP6_9GAST|nr:hypothetical protein PoB_000237800 [Plakobranchus ocellatus]
MEAFLNAFVVLLTLSTTIAYPSAKRNFGEYVSECVSGDPCLTQQYENDTIAYLNDLTFCCSSGNTITISIVKSSPRFNQSVSSSLFSDDGISGVYYTNDVALSLPRNSSAQVQSKVVCECREVDVDEVEGVLGQIGRRVFSNFKRAVVKLANLLR